MDTLTPTALPVVSLEAWLTARKALLEKEKETLRAYDKLREERLKMPWVKVEKTYVFDTPKGPRTLADLFEGRSQLLIQHFMFGPEWEEGCVGCSLGADHMQGIWPHLEHHDVKFTVVARAPLDKIEAFKARMKWAFDWVSSHRSDFNFDYGVSFTEAEKAANTVTYNFREDAYSNDELPGMSVFYKDGDTIYHTYSVYARGTEMASGVFGLLDITPKGRNETGPNFDMTDWLRHRDKYDVETSPNACGCE